MKQRLMLAWKSAWDFSCLTILRLRLVVYRMLPYHIVHIAVSWWARLSWFGWNTPSVDWNLLCGFGVSVYGWNRLYTCKLAVGVTVLLSMMSALYVMSLCLALIIRVPVSSNRWPHVIHLALVNGNPYPRGFLPTIVKNIFLLYSSIVKCFLML